MTPDEVLFRTYFQNHIREMISDYMEKLSDGELDGCVFRTLNYFLELEALFDYFYVLTEKNVELILYKIGSLTKNNDLISIYQKIYQ